jgi:hypothetical protein
VWRLGRKTSGYPIKAKYQSFKILMNSDVESISEFGLNAEGFVCDKAP